MKPHPVWLVPPLALGAGAALPAIAQDEFTPDITYIERQFEDGIDGWWNYDFHDETLSDTNTDWPINMVWAVKGDITDVKNWLLAYDCSEPIDGWSVNVCEGWRRHPEYLGFGVTCAGWNAQKYAFVTENANNPSSEWDGDCGVKSGCQEQPDGRMRELHTRLYAPTGGEYHDHFVSIEWGFYILGTTHYDFNDWGSWMGIQRGCYSSKEKQFGWSETVESKIGAIARNGGLLVSGNVLTYPTPSPPTYRDDTGMLNSGEGWKNPQRTSFHESDGQATMVYFKEETCFVDMLDPYTGELITIEVDAPASARVCADEAFAPLVVVSPFSDIRQAIRDVDSSDYGLQAGIFTRDLEHAWQAFEGIDAGGVIINDVPTWRIDHMPYGGTKKSGLGREGLRYAIEEMTELRLLAINRAWVDG